MKEFGEITIILWGSGASLFSMSFITILWSLCSDVGYYSSIIADTLSCCVKSS